MAAALPYVAVASTVAGMASNMEAMDTAAQAAQVEQEGNAAAAAAAQRAAERKRVALEFEAKELEVQAGQQIASAQRQRDEEERTARLTASRALAVAAASGASASDTTVVNLISRVKGEGALRGAVALYEGEAKARALRIQAMGRRYESAVAIEGGNDLATAYGYKNQAAQIKAQAQQTAAMGNIFSGIGNLATGNSGLFSKYGGGGVQSFGAGDSSLLWAGPGMVG